MSDETKVVQIGETQYKIPRFKGLKAGLAGALISKTMRDIPELQKSAQTFRRTFREQNTLVLTPGMAKLPRFSPLGFTPEDFAASGGKIELPEEPTAQAIAINMFPDLFELAYRQLQKFFAILVISNRELEEADDADEVDEVLKRWGKRVMREGDVDELLDLVVTGLEVFKEQMASKRDRLGELQIPWLDSFLNMNQEEPENLGPGQTSPTPDDENPSPWENSAQPLFSDAVDGDSVEETSSTEPLGVSSS